MKSRSYHDRQELAACYNYDYIVTFSVLYEDGICTLEVGFDSSCEKGFIRRLGKAPGFSEPVSAR